MLNEYAMYKGKEVIAIGTVKDIARKLGIEEHSVYYYGMPCYLKRISPGSRYLVKINDRQECEYALYKGEDILAIGSIDEIAKEVGVSKKTIFHYGTPTYAKRVSENGRRLVKLGVVEC